MTSQNPLGRKIKAPKGYAPELLFPIPRARGREQINASKQQFAEMWGYDVWTCWEVYWLNSNGEANHSVLQLIVPVESLCIVESKSLKLYLNGFNNERVASPEQLLATIQEDLQKLLNAEIKGDWLDLSRLGRTLPKGRCLYSQQGEGCATKNCYWDTRFRSLCPVTGQPDFATAYVENFLGSEEYLVGYWQSFTQHQGYHEQCAEQIFIKLQREQEVPLRFGLAFVRRGGIDIHPIRFHQSFCEQKKLSSRLQEVLRTPWQ